MNSNYNNIPSPFYGNGITYPQEQRLNYIDIPYSQNYMNNIISLNKGKKVKLYLNFPTNNELSGVIEQVGRDYIVISDPLTNKWHLVPICYLNYISFDEKINYNQEYLSNK